jgi:transposase
MNYIGMDLHRRHTTFCIVDEAGTLVRRGKVDSTEQGWTAVLASCEAGCIELAIETGSLTWWVVDVARGLGIEPVVVDARQFKLIASSKKKSDRRDAFHLADALRAGLAQRCSVTVPSARARSGRGILQARSTVVKQCTASRNAVAGLLRSIGLRISLRRFASDEYWAQLIASDCIPEWMRTALEIHRGNWQALQAARRKFDVMVASELEHWPEAAKLTDVPGYGKIVTLAVVSSVDDHKRFRTHKQVASYAGIVPIVRDSGDAVHRGGITHEGRTLLRFAMIQAAQSAIRSRELSPSLRRWATKLLVRKGRQVMAVALGRRLLELGFKLLRTHAVYDPTYGAEVAA